MSRLIIKNGIVYDPLNEISGEEKDIFIEDGRIVESFPEDGTKTVDASGKVVMPGGVDHHSHIAGSKVNSGRFMRPEEGKYTYSKNDYPRSGSGYSVPSTFVTGYLYAKMGWTTVVDPAMPPLKARHTHEEFMDTPIIDKAAFPLFGNNSIVMEYLKEKDIEGCAAYVAWMLRATKGYAVKLVNPGGTASWGWGRNVSGLDDPTPYFDVTPGEIIRGLEEVNELLALPHSIHVHGNNLGSPGNYKTTLETIRRTKGVKPGDPKRENILHITHAQFNAYGGTNWRDFESKSRDIAEEVNKRDDVVIDIGAVTFDNTTTMTADGPWEHRLHHITGGLKWINGDVELECGSGVTPYVFSSKNPVNVVQWAIGLELSLLIDEPKKVLINTDHPNGGPFTKYPEIISWLVSEDAREEEMEKMNKNVERSSILPTIDKELDLGDIAWMTRAGNAKLLGLRDKGHLGPGAVADISIYDVDPRKDDISKDYEKVRRAFSDAYLCIKDGEIVVKNGRIQKAPMGRTHWVDVQVPEELEGEVEDEIERQFKKYYTVNMNNYPVQSEYLPRPEPISIDASENF